MLIIVVYNEFLIYRLFFLLKLDRPENRSGLPLLEGKRLVDYNQNLRVIFEFSFMIFLVINLLERQPSTPAHPTKGRSSSWCLIRVTVLG